MNKLLSLIAMAALVLVGCENINPSDSAKIRITTESTINVSYMGGIQEIGFETTGGEPINGALVEATTTSSWISDITVESGIVRINVLANTSTNSRVGKVTLSYLNSQAEVTVMQEGQADTSGVHLTLNSERRLNYTAVGGSGQISYTLEAPEADALPEVSADCDWIGDFNIEDSTIDFVVARNTTSSMRRGTITLSYGGKEAEVAVVQEASTNETVLTANETMIRIGQELRFTVVFAGEDVTSEAQIYDYYTNSEVQSTMVFDEVKEHVFYAMYNGIRSKVLTINVIPANAPDFPIDTNVDSFDFNYRMLLVDHTGVDCGYCPGMKELLKDVSSNELYCNNINIVYAYTFSTSDKCYSTDANTVKEYYKQVCKNSSMPLSGYPSVTFNYLHDHAASTNTVTKQLDLLNRESADAAIAVATALEGNTLTISAELKSAVSQSYNIAVWVLEDDVYAHQAGAYADWMHTHHSVLRDCITDISKTDISGISWGYVRANSSLRRVLELPIEDNSLWVKENFKLAIIISAPNHDKNGKYEVVNSVICNIGESVGFEYND